jgi:hypothetical protein
VFLIWVILVLRVPMILDLRLLFVYDKGRTLEEAWLRILLVAKADVHLAFVLDHLLLEEVVLAIAMVLLLQELILSGSDLGLLRMALDAALFSRFRLFGIMDDTWGAWSEVSAQTLRIRLLLLLIL